MKLQLWRNATLLLSINGKRLLIDPMLSSKGELGVFPWIDDTRSNPLLDLPFSENELTDKLKEIDAVFVSHLHPDHWDRAAATLIDKKIPVFCPATLRESIESQGFKNVQEILNYLTFSDIEIHITNGRHGKGEIGKIMGEVNGFVFKGKEQSVYLAGDTIWCEEILETVSKHQPQHIIVAGGAATFAIGEPVTMTVEDIRKIAEHNPASTIWITHLEAVSPCTEDRQYIKRFITEEQLVSQCKILNDGEEVELR